MKIKKVEKLVANLHDKSEYVIHITISNQPLNCRLLSRNFIELSKI